MIINKLAIGRKIYQGIVKRQPKSANWKSIELFQAIKKYTPTVKHSSNRYDRNGNLNLTSRIYDNIQTLQQETMPLAVYC